MLADPLAGCDALNVEFTQQLARLTKQAWAVLEDRGLPGPRLPLSSPAVDYPTEPTTIADRLGGEEAGFARAETRAALERLLALLDQRAREVLHLTYEADLTSRSGPDRRLPVLEGSPGTPSYQRVMDPYEILGITPAYKGDLRALRNLLVKRYFEAGETPDEERMKAINLAYELLSDPARRRVASAPEPLSIATSALPAARVGEPYRAQLAAVGGASPYAWEAVLPAGLALDSSGAIDGRVERTGCFPLTLTVADRDGRTAQRVFVLQVEPVPLRVLTDALPNATIGEPYEAELRVEGGVAPLRWSGEPPAGLQLGAGLLFGTPLGPSAVLPLELCVRDAARQTACVSLLLIVRPAAAAGDATEWTPERLADEQHAQAAAAHEADVDVATTRARIAVLERRLARRPLELRARSPPRSSSQQPSRPCCRCSWGCSPSRSPGRHWCARSAPRSSLPAAGPSSSGSARSSAAAAPNAPVASEIPPTPATQRVKLACASVRPERAALRSDPARTDAPRQKRQGRRRYGAVQISAEEDSDGGVAIACARRACAHPMHARHVATGWDDDAMGIEALDIVYAPSRDVEADVRFYRDMLGARIVFAIEAMGARVAEVAVAPEGPRLILADHLPADGPILLHRVSDLDETLAELRTRGLRLEGRVELPLGPCATLSSPGGQRVGLYQLTRPEVDAHFVGRTDFG